MPDPSRKRPTNQLGTRAGNLTDDPGVRSTESGIARVMFRVAMSGRREQEASFLTLVVWRDQPGHAAQSLAKGSRVGASGRRPPARYDPTVTGGPASPSPQVIDSPSHSAR